MAEYTKGTVRKFHSKRQGWRWQGVLSYYVCSEGGRKKQRQLTRVFDIPCDPDKNPGANSRKAPEGRGAKTALEALAEWRAEVIAADQEAERQRAEKAELDRRRVTVRDYVSTFVEQRAAMGIIEESTLKDYRKVWRNYIAPEGAHYLGGITLQDLTAADVREWEAHLSAEKPQGGGYSPNTVGKAHRLLKEAITQARADGIIATDPMLNIKPPKRGASHPNALGLDAAPLVLQKLDAMQETYLTVAARLAIYTGMRRGEICALQWRDVDLEGRTIRVRRSVGVKDGGTYLKDTKTDKVRAVSIPEPLARSLKAWKADQALGYIQLGIGAGGIAEQFVIGSGAPGAYRDPGDVTRDWKVLARQFGIKGTEGRVPTFHDLRHTFATVAIAGGVDVKTVSSTLGHANAAMTLNVYASSDPQAQRAAADKVAGLLAPKNHGFITMNGTEG